MVLYCRSAAGAFGLPSTFGEFIYKTIAMISLDLDTPAVDCAARATLFLEFRCKRIEFGGWQSQAADDRHSFAFAALSFTADTHHTIGCRFARCTFLTHAFAHGA